MDEDEGLSQEQFDAAADTGFDAAEAALAAAGSVDAEEAVATGIAYALVMWAGEYADPQGQITFLLDTIKGMATEELGTGAEPLTKAPEGATLH